MRDERAFVCPRVSLCVSLRACTVQYVACSECVEKQMYSQRVVVYPSVPVVHPTTQTKTRAHQNRTQCASGLTPVQVGWHTMHRRCLQCTAAQILHKHTSLTLKFKAGFLHRNLSLWKLHVQQRAEEGPGDRTFLWVWRQRVSGWGHRRGVWRYASAVSHSHSSPVHVLAALIAIGLVLCLNGITLHYMTCPLADAF